MLQDEKLIHLLFFTTVTTSESHSHAAAASESHTEPHNLVGPPLVLGFILMLIIDQFSGGHRKPGSCLQPSITFRNQVPCHFFDFWGFFLLLYLFLLHFTTFSFPPLHFLLVMFSFDQWFRQKFSVWWLLCYISYTLLWSQKQSVISHSWLQLHIW